MIQPDTRASPADRDIQYLALRRLRSDSDRIFDFPGNVYVLFIVRQSPSPLCALRCLDRASRKRR